MKLVLVTATLPGTGPTGHMKSLAAGFKKFNKKVDIVFLRKSLPRRTAFIKGTKKTSRIKHFLKEIYYLIKSTADIKVSLSRQIRSADVVIIRGGINVWAPILLAKLQRKYIFYEIDAPIIVNSLELKDWVFPKIPVLVDRINRLLADTVIFVSKETIYSLEQNGEECPENIAILPNAVHEQNIIKKPLYIQGKLKIAFMGTFHEWHGIVELCKAIELIRHEGHCQGEISWHFIGDGECMPLVKSCAKKNSNVFIHGWISSEDEIDELLKNCHIGIAPYRNISDFYFSPLKIYRYLSNGMACIASGQGQIIDIVDEDNGWILKKSSPEEIRDSIYNAVNNRHIVEKKRKASISKILPFTWENNAKKLLDILSRKGVYRES